MPIFQKSVIKKHLRGLNTVWLNTAYNKYKEIFNRKKIERIKFFKEEEYQDGFFRDLFVDVLGYTLKTDNENFNLVREFKNRTDGKKADGAIIKDKKAVAVIELKSTSTKDLTSITHQAFNYKHNQPGCKYVITSNFQKLRFYVDYSNEYEEFDLFNLQKSDFELLYLILRKNAIFNDTPQKLKDETRFHEKNISEQLYKDYSNFKNKIFENIVKRNPKIDKLTLFKKSQKLLDRLLFIFFAEDCGLLPANSISRIIERYDQLIKLDAYKPLYQIYLQYFGYMNLGRKGQIPIDDIPAYNGGLFAPDKLLDNLKIDDKVLRTDCLKLSAYDFSTDVDVNILGHIFEHSLNEIEEMEQNLAGINDLLDLKISKRKKDGVFYTPKYITQYIVENTIGTLCSEKRKEMQIYEIEFDQTHKTKKSLSKKGKLLFKKLIDYKKWLKSLKILDPACGSGAFLNQALIFLIAEHKLIDDFIADLTKQKVRLFDTDKNILENNLYGVDINNESVEIAKLSLWLRTAQKGRELSTLNNNIKCGNSLIDDPKVAGDKAFDWNIEFEEIMDNGGFDVVIGNPPYVVVKKSNIYKSYKWKTDLYLLFLEQSFKKLLKSKTGLLGFITPRYFMVNKINQDLRLFMLKEVDLLKIVETIPFDDANTECVISIFKNDKSKNNTIYIYEDKCFKIEQINTVKKSFFLRNGHNEILTFLTDEQIKILIKLEVKSTKLDDITESRRGMELGKKQLNENSGVPALIGQDVKKYSIQYKQTHINSLNKQYLRLKTFFSNKNIIYLRRVASHLIVTVSDKQYAFSKNIYGLVPNKNFNSYFLCLLLNSKLLDFYYKKKFSMKKVDIFPEIQTYLFKLLPIKQISQENQQPFIAKADKMLMLNKELQIKSDKFIKRIKSNLEIQKISRKLQKFYNFDFKTFILELKKQKIKLSFKDQDEWEDYFDSYKQKINRLQTQINQTDKQIDKMVYKLYELTEEEIEIVENETK